MPLLRPSPSDFTTVVKALANAGAAVSNPQGSRPPSKGGVAFVNAASVTAMIRGSPRLASIAPIIRPVVPFVAAVPTLPIDPYNYTTYETSSVFNKILFEGRMARDASGNFYGRKSDFKYYKFSPTGVETFLAGDGNGDYAVFTPGLGAAARFGANGGVKDIVLDSSGNLFTVHSYTHRIIKIAPNGNVTSYAGTGTEGFGDGPIGTATFSNPSAIAIDASNTLYVYELGRKTIRKITSSGQVSTLTFSAAFTPYFYSLAVDSTGVIYGLDTYVHRVYKIIPTGPTTADIALLAGSTQGYANGQGSAAQFNTQIGGIAVDTFGNVYVGDDANGSVRKISPSGNVITIAGTGVNVNGEDTNTILSYPRTPIVDRNGVVYVSTDGHIRKISPVIASLANAGSNDVFVVKYDSDGTPLWARRIGGGLTEGFRASQIDSTGNVIVCGTYTSNPVTIFGADGITPFTTLDNPGLSTTTETFIVKYNSSGTPQWVRRVGGTENESLSNLNLSGEDIILSGGYTSNPVTIFNADGTPSFTTLAKAGTSTTRDSFITKYNSGGTPQWVRRIGGDGNDDINGTIVDLSGNIFVFVAYSSTSTNVFNADGTPFATLASAGNSDSLIIKYSSDGTPQWVRRIGGSNSDSGSNIITDLSGNIIVGINYQSNPVTIFQANGVDTLTTFTNASTGSDILIVKYASNGDFVWARRLGGSNDSDINYSLSVDSNGNIIVTGSYTGGTFTIFNAAGNAAFDPLTIIGGQDDGFIVKYSPNGTPQWIRKIAGSVADQPRAIMDSSGNTIVRIGGGPSIIYDASQNPLTSLNRISIAKHDTNGTLLWHTYDVFSGTGNAFISTHSIDSNNNIIASVSVTNGILTLYDSSGNAAATFTNAENQSEPFIVKYSPSGNILWAKRSVSGPLNDSISSIRIDSTNNLVVVGPYASNPLTIT